MIEDVDLPPSMRITKVSVVDINMPFRSMVVFMVKWALASVPALIILVMIAFAVVSPIGLIGTLAGPSGIRSTTGRTSFEPTLAGLTGIVLANKFPCIDSPSNQMRSLSDGRWRLDCPGESYDIQLTEAGDVVSVRRAFR